MRFQSGGCHSKPFCIIASQWNQTFGHSALFSGRFSLSAFSLTSAKRTKKSFGEWIQHHEKYFRSLHQFDLNQRKMFLIVISIQSPSLPNILIHFRHIKEGNILSCPDNTPPSVYALMKACWNPKPNNRPNFKTLLHSLNSIREDFIKKQGQTVMMWDVISLNFSFKRSYWKPDELIIWELLGFPSEEYVH